MGGKGITQKHTDKTKTKNNKTSKSPKLKPEKLKWNIFM